MIDEENGVRCTREAYLSQRLHNGEPDHYNAPRQVVEGEDDSYDYEARCWIHHEVDNAPQRYAPPVQLLKQYLSSLSIEELRTLEDYDIQQIQQRIKQDM